MARFGVQIDLQFGASIEEGITKEGRNERDGYSDGNGRPDDDIDKEEEEKIVKIKLIY
jgi:hypothetical protein